MPDGRFRLDLRKSNDYQSKVYGIVFKEHYLGALLWEPDIAEEVF
jgi:hypothetical protein